MSKLLLIDGNSIMNRAFYGIMGNKMLMTPDGKYTNAIYGFLSILFKTLNDVTPEYIAVAFDMRAPTKRHLKYAEYKGTRKGMPNELAEQMPIIKEILTAMNVQIYEQEGYEADDIVGTLSKFGEKQGLEVCILSGDRDNLQLVSEKTTVLLPRTKEGKTETEQFNEAKVIEVYGITPIQLIETKGLMGDSSDNIPGVPGVGEKTAFDLIKRYNSIDELYKNIEDNTDDISEESLRSNSKLVTEGKGKGQGVIKGKVREKLIENKELAYLSKELGTIDINSPIEKDLGKIKLEKYDNEKLLEIFTELRFNRFIEKLGLENEFSDCQGHQPIHIPDIVDGRRPRRPQSQDIHSDRRYKIFLQTILLFR